MKIGAHVSISGGVFNAPINAQAEGLETFQMFSRSPRSFAAPPLTDEAVAEFKVKMKELGFEQSWIHAPYLLNLASANTRAWHGSITMLRTELERASLLGVDGVMFHTGSAASQPTREDGFKAAIEGLNKVLDGYTGSAMMLIENAAGAGSVVGCTFEEVAQLIAGIKKNKKKVGFCLDTQHAFASGYDMRTKKDVDTLVKEIDKHIGLDLLKVVQLNDSKTEFDSKKDRHEHIHLGKIGEEGMTALVNHPKLKHLDFILETEPEERDKDVATLRRIRK